MPDEGVIQLDGKDVTGASSDTSTVVTPDPAQQAASTTPVDTGTDKGGEPPAWVRQRLSESTKRATDAEKRYQTSDAEVKRLTQQIAQYSALVGAPAPDARSNERTELRALMLEAFPELDNSKAKESEATELKELKATLAFLQKQHWSTHANTAVTGMLGKAREGFKRDLAPGAERVLHLAFSSFVQSDEELTNRFMDGDPTLVDDFYTLVSKGFIEPLAATTSADGTAQKVAKLPNTGGGATLVSGNDTSGETPMDERSSKDLMNTAFDVFQRARNQK